MKGPITVMEGMLNKIKMYSLTVWKTKIKGNKPVSLGKAFPRIGSMMTKALSQVATSLASDIGSTQSRVSEDHWSELIDSNEWRQSLRYTGPKLYRSSRVNASILY